MKLPELDVRAAFVEEVLVALESFVCHCEVFLRAGKPRCLLSSRPFTCLKVVDEERLDVVEPFPEWHQELMEPRLLRLLFQIGKRLQSCLRARPKILNSLYVVNHDSIDCLIASLSVPVFSNGRLPSNRKMNTKKFERGCILLKEPFPVPSSHLCARAFGVRFPTGGKVTP